MQLMSFEHNISNTLYTLLNIYNLIQSFIFRLVLTLLGLDTLEEAGISRLLLVVVVPEKCGTLALKDARDPGVLVGDSPDSHTNASLDSHAGLGDALVSIGLDLELLGGGGSVHAEVNFGVDNVNAKVGSSAESSLEGLLVGSSTGGSGGGLAGKMGLVANTVDADAVGLDELDDASSTLGLLRVVLKVVVIVEELSLAAVLVGEAESNRKEGLADGVVPDTGAVGTVLVQSLVDYIPACANALVASHDGLDVVLHDTNKGFVVESALRYPWRQLRVPDEGVAVNLEVVLLGVFSVSVGIRESKVVARWLNRLPLHRVLGSEGVEVGLDDLALTGLVAESQSRADEVASSLLHGLVKTVIILLVVAVGTISMLASCWYGSNMVCVRAGNGGAGKRQAGDDAGETHSD
jgi:hypothetical protein